MRREDLETFPEEAILAAPDTPESYAALGDWLLEHSDPRGELVALQVERALGKPRERAEGWELEEFISGERAPTAEELLARENELIESHRQEWLDPFWGGEWRFGHIVRFAMIHATPLRYERLLARPAMRYVRALDLHAPWGAYEGDLARTIATEDLPPVLRRLGLYGNGSKFGETASVGSVDALWPVLGSLDDLAIVETALLTLGPIVLPSARRVSFGTNLTSALVADLAAAHWPALESFTLRHDSAAPSPSLEPLLDALRIRSRLSRLALGGMDVRTLEPLLRHPLTARLTSLKLVVDEETAGWLESEHPHDHITIVIQSPEPDVPLGARRCRICGHARGGLFNCPTCFASMDGDWEPPLPSFDPVG